MTKIKEILTLDLQEDIKNVIDLEDRSEQENREAHGRQCGVAHTHRIISVCLDYTGLSPY